MPFRSRTESPEKERADFRKYSKMFPYIWAFKSRVIFAISIFNNCKIRNSSSPHIIERDS